MSLSNLSMKQVKQQGLGIIRCSPLLDSLKLPIFKMATLMASQRSRRQQPDHLKLWKISLEMVPEATKGGILAARWVVVSSLGEPPTTGRPIELIKTILSL